MRHDTQYTTRTTVTLSRHISSYTLSYKDPSTNLISEQIAVEKGERGKCIYCITTYQFDENNIQDVIRSTQQERQ